MRRTFLRALLAGVCATAVFAPAAMTKKGPPPPAPAGTFTLSPGATIQATNMTIASQDQVQILACYSIETGQCANLGDNSAATTPGEEVALADWSFTNTNPFSISFRLVLFDFTTESAYISDGTLFTAGKFQPGTHVTLGWTEDARAILVSMNDGSQNTATDWQPALGEGNFNATVEVTAPKPPKPTGVTITHITGYSDGATLDEANIPVCSFHAEFTYTLDKKVAKTVTSLVAAAGLIKGGEGFGTLEQPLGESPFNPGLFYGPTNLPSGTDYMFAAYVDSSHDTRLASQTTAMFPLDQTTFVDGCPPVGELISTDIVG